MSQIAVSHVLDQLRQLSLQASAAPEGAVTSNVTAADGQSMDFGSLLQQSISAVGAAQTEAGKQAAAFERGDAGADLASTMVATQKAELSVRALTEVRNKLTDAYTNIMNMPV